MSIYPGYPDNRLIVNGVDLTQVYGLVLLDGFTLQPPEPKTYTVDIPGADGEIDLTESLLGTPVYQNRKQEFTFAVLDSNRFVFEQIKTKLSNFLHGRTYEYKISVDPEYTYTGRFTVSSYSHGYLYETIVVSVSAKPYKLKQHMAYSINATGGHMYRFESGRRKVHPVIETKNAIHVEYDGVSYDIPAGTHRLNFCVFSEGPNDLYINSRRLYAVVWDDLNQNGSNPLTYNQASEQKLRWDDLQRLGESSESTPQKWSDVALSSWEDYSATRWNEVDYKADAVNDGLVYVTYDWEDL